MKCDCLLVYARMPHPAHCPPRAPLQRARITALDCLSPGLNCDCVSRPPVQRWGMLGAEAAPPLRVCDYSTNQTRRLPGLFTCAGSDSARVAADIGYMRRAVAA